MIYMRQAVSVRADVRWPTTAVQLLMAEEVYVLFGARRPALGDPGSTAFPVELRVPLGGHGAVSCVATAQVGVVVDGARALTITPATKRWLFPSFEGTITALPRDGGCALAITGTASVPWGLLVHRRWGRRSLERSLAGLPSAWRPRWTITSTGRLGLKREGDSSRWARLNDAFVGTSERVRRALSGGAPGQRPCRHCA
jgi:hypothetical protein